MDRAPNHPADVVRMGIIVGALGVVFGDIGTSPIYTLQTVFSPTDPHPVPVDDNNVYGVVSLVFWSLMLIVTVTYVLLAMRVDNDGEGGIMALITLLRRRATQTRARTMAILAALGLFGAALFLGDSMITPAISVLSSVEGFKVVNPSFADWVIPLTVVIIFVLFVSAALRHGSSRATVRADHDRLVSLPSLPAASGESPANRRSSRRCPRATRSSSCSVISAWRSSRLRQSSWRSREPRPSTPTWVTSGAARSHWPGSSSSSPPVR